jgi:GAF domain-containing protein
MRIVRKCIDHATLHVYQGIRCIDHPEHRPAEWWNGGSRKLHFDEPNPDFGRLHKEPSLMHSHEPISGLTKLAVYRELKTQLTGLFAGERDGLANAANTAAALYHGLPDLNWAGFYFLRGGVLVLGPFQGKVACVRIPLGSGVCGTAAERRDAVLVADVHAFPGHIACDVNSRSEIVIPLVHRRRLLGVLDLDSPSLARFDDEDRAGLSAIVELLLESSDLSRFVDLI